MGIDLPANCNQCPKSCPADALSCGKGRAYFERLQNGENSPEIAGSENELVRLLTKCGKVAEHKSEKMREHGKDEAVMFQCLTGEEKAKLQELLSKLQTTWKEDHAKHYGLHSEHNHAHNPEAKSDRG